MKLRLSNTIIVGNGLGRTLSSEAYNLNSALNLVWNNLEENERIILQTCLEPSSKVMGLKTESDLKNLHKIWESSRTIVDNCTDSELLITPALKELPLLANYFCFRVAAQLALIQDQKNFKDKAKDGLKELDTFCNKLLYHNENINVATLNYDRLLYGRLVKLRTYRKFFDGFIDGEMRSIKRNNQSYYLHLHGSPLFQILENGQKCIKIQTSELKSFQKLTFEKWKKKFGSKTYFPIILNNEKDKFSWIESDPILGVFFDRFRTVLSESKTIASFGYGWGDSHINQVLLDSLRINPSCLFHYIHHSKEPKTSAFWTSDFYKEFKDRIKTYPYTNLNDWNLHLNEVIPENIT